MDDGKKRALFVLVNFLTSVGWSYDKIEELLKEWNKKNKEPVREVYLVGQIRYHKSHKKKVLPPNCANKMYYQDLGFCKPDELCRKIKNPVNYSRIKTLRLNSGNKKKQKPL
jgi:DNA primase large subunit